MKFTKRLDYSRLAQALAERDMVDLSAIQELLQASNDGGQAFPEALVSANLVSDWDLSRIVSEVFHLPFLPVDQADPDKELLSLFHAQLLHNTGLVPISKYGNVLTIAMPAIVQADTLALLSAESNMVILPIVGTVDSNRKWLGENCKVETFEEDSGWGNLFDEGDAAVQETLGSGPETSSSSSGFSMDDLDAGPLGAGDTADLNDSLEFDTSDLEFDEPGGPDLSGLDILDDVPSLTDVSGLEVEEMEDSLQFDVAQVDEEEDSSPGDLPPMPDFNA